jgi:hypothetical protein
MGHNLRAIIGKPLIAEALASRFKAVRRVPLRQGFEMVPLVGRLFDEMAFSPDAKNPEAAVSGWSNLGKQPEALLAELSRGSPVAYINTDYFGGCGDQSALAFADGRLATPRSGAGRVLPWSSSIGPINDALAAIGVTRERDQDEFDSLGLGQHRSMDDWEPEEEE